MEVRLDKRYPVSAGVEQAWAVLADIRATAACMPGAQITEQVDETHYKGTVKSKVGPAVMSFNGEIEVLGMDSTRRELKMLGKGADKAGSSASMNLTAHVEPGEAADSAVLVGQAVITVSGKLAQFGSRLLVPVSDAMLAQFARNFSATAATVEMGDGGTDEPAAQAAPALAPSALPPAPALAATGAAEASTEPPTSAEPRPAAAQPAAHPDAAAAHPAPAAPSPRRAVPVVHAQPARELNALALMWTVVKSWFAGLLGRKRP
jgi:uncharacterized protein